MYTCFSESSFIGISWSSRPEVFCKNGVVGNFAKFTGKHLCQSLLFNKVAGKHLRWLLLYLVDVHNTFTGPPGSYLNNLGTYIRLIFTKWLPHSLLYSFLRINYYYFLWNSVPEAFSSWCYKAYYLVSKLLKSRKQIWKCFEGTLIVLLKNIYH